jgi:hypothetical protein
VIRLERDGILKSRVKVSNALLETHKQQMCLPKPTFASGYRSTPHLTILEQVVRGDFFQSVNEGIHWSKKVFRKNLLRHS